MKPFTYLLINFFTVFVCFLFSFHPKIRFYKHFDAFIKAVLLASILFISWDIWFTKVGVWWFNTNYTLGLSILNLPMEEWMFFICIPFSCVFTYFCFTKFFDLKWADKYSKQIVILVTVLCSVVILLNYNRLYPLVTATVTAGFLLYLFFVAGVNWIGSATLVYLVLMLGFFPVNGILTGSGLESPIVNYNPEQILNIRMFTIPVEDAFFGYSQFLLNVYFFLLFKKSEEKTSDQTYVKSKITTAYE